MIESAEEFKRLRESENIEEYTRASQEEASEHIWIDIIRTYPEMKIWVIHNKTVPLSILERLAKDPDASIRASVAGKRKLSVDLFNLLASDEDHTVRYQIGLNRKVPADVLERLVNDPDPWVRNSIAEALRNRGS